MIDASNGWMNYYYDGTMSHTNIRYMKVKKNPSVLILRGSGVY